MITNADYIREASYVALAALLQSPKTVIHPHAMPTFVIPEDEMAQFEKDFRNTNKYDFLFP